MKKEEEKLLEDALFAVVCFCAVPRPLAAWSSQIHSILENIEIAENHTPLGPKSIAMRDKLLHNFYGVKFQFWQVLTEQFEQNYFEKYEIEEVKKLLKLVENKKIIVKTLKT